jgi:hypothetical protein
MSSQSSGAARPGEATQPGEDGWPEDDEWSGDDDGRPPQRPGGYPPYPAMMPPPGGGKPGGPIRPLALLGVALLALVVGAGVALAVLHLVSGPAAPSTQAGAAPPSTAPSPGSPGQPGGTGQLPGGSTGQLPSGGASQPAGSGPFPGTNGGQIRIFFAGRITKLSHTSITLQAMNRTITAAITSSTKVTGHPKVGDIVSAHISGSGNGNNLTATSIQDPPTPP